MFDGLESYGGEEASTGSLEQVSEQAKERFAEAARQMKQMKKDEKKAKKRDQQVAMAILQFLSDDDQSRFLNLVTALVARNCPSLFILGLLSLINEGCLQVVQEYFVDHKQKNALDLIDESMDLFEGGSGNPVMNRDLIAWITRLQLILAHEPVPILESLLIDEKHLDGSVLQLSIFILQEYFFYNDLSLPYDKAQPLTASILQTVFEPFLHYVKKRELASGEDDNENEDDD